MSIIEFLALYAIKPDKVSQPDGLPVAGDFALNRRRPERKEIDHRAG
jgi:hypothetical protein